jgi:LCP family protein required for cell wall assembly
MAWTAGGLTVLLLGIAVTGYAMFRHFNNNIAQANISKALGKRPPDLHPQAENFVVIGSDSRQGTSAAAEDSTDQSDTLMIIHIPADRKWAEVMSIPRDSYVNIPACTMGNGKLSAPTEFKINEAFAIGNLYGNHAALGAACTIKTIEQDTGIFINHFMVMDFTGFKNMVAALGGVEECSPVALDAPGSGLDLSAGYHMLNPTEALTYVRARYGLGDGSDLERIVRQQAFMTSLTSRAKSELYDPLAIYRFLDAATQSVTIDSQLGGLVGLYNLEQSLRSIPTGKVAFFALPNYPRANVVPTDTANVLWTQPEDSAIFGSFRDDVPASASLFAAPAQQAAAQHRPGKSGVSPASPSVNIASRTASQSICVS